MAFFSDLFESFAPTLAFADNDDSTVVDNSTRSGIESTPESTTIEGEDKSEEQKEQVPEPASTEVKEAKQEEATPAEEEKAGEPVAEEEAPPTEEPSEEVSAEETSEDAEEGGDDEEEEEEEEDDEDEDDDEEEGVDPLDRLKEECSQQPAIKPYVHHYAECVERVTKEQEEEGYEDKDYKEDCVEEFFHLQHHLNDCVAPRLFYKLK